MTQKKLEEMIAEFDALSPIIWRHLPVPDGTDRPLPTPEQVQRFKYLLAELECATCGMICEETGYCSECGASVVTLEED